MTNRIRALKSTLGWLHIRVCAFSVWNSDVMQYSTSIVLEGMWEFISVLHTCKQYLWSNYGTRFKLIKPNTNLLSLPGGLFSLVAGVAWHQLCKTTPTGGIWPVTSLRREMWATFLYVAWVTGYIWDIFHFDVKPEAAVVYICLLIKLLYLADCVRIYLLQINHTDVFIYCKLTILMYLFICKLTILMYLFICKLTILMCLFICKLTILMYLFICKLTILMCLFLAN